MSASPAPGLGRELTAGLLTVRGVTGITGSVSLCTICSLPRSPGSCSNWSSRYHYDPATGTCSHFWYGGCHGNSNNFPTREECQRQCDAADRHPQLLYTSGRGAESSRQGMTDILPSLLNVPSHG
uniref:Papilin-like n=1 Tax=Paramormyrops kingsleyae TaxID=1676925 RepID=A0A3B3QH02_9TELE